MNIVGFLNQCQRTILATLPEADQSLDNWTLIHEKIKKHIRYFELYESLEENFLKQSRLLLEARGQTPMIQFCNNGNARIWCLLDQLVQVLNSHHFPSIQKAIRELVAYEEFHFNFKVQSFFPLLQRLMDHETMESLGRRGLSFYRRFYPTLQGTGDGAENNPVQPAHGRFAFLNNPKRTGGIT